MLVLTAPTFWIKEPKSQTIAINENINWVCESSGFPLPFVKWEKQFGK